VPEDRIRLRNITVYGRHGVTEEERAVGRPFEIDIELACDLSCAGETDDLGTTIDYAAICQTVHRVNEAGPYMLLEAFAARMANDILVSFAVDQVTVRVRKPHPPVGVLVEAAEVEITRSR
jgi:dihydroneopterin aldolase